jgi:hypothetical protein
MIFERNQRRLYISESKGLHVFKVTNDSPKFIIDNMK